MEETPSFALIQFGYDKNGGLELLIAKEIWPALQRAALAQAEVEAEEIARAAVRRDSGAAVAAIEEEASFIRLSLSGDSLGVQSFSLVARSESPPCPPRRPRRPGRPGGPRA